MEIKSGILTSLILASLPAVAGTAIPTIQPNPESPWSCRTALYGWAEALKGDMGVAGRVADVDLSFNDILKHMDMAFMAALEVGYNRWSFMADVMYADISGSKDRGGAYVRAEEQQFLGNFIVAYEAMKTDGYKFDVYAGARVNSIKATLDLRGQRLLDFHGSSTETWVDPIIGARFQCKMSDRYFFRTVGDIGGFGGRWIFFR